jgi:hypothetical protein
LTNGEFSAGTFFDNADNFVPEDCRPGRNPITGLEYVKVGSADACVLDGNESAASWRRRQDALFQGERKILT